MLNDSKYEKKLKSPLNIIKINTNNYIVIGEYETKGNDFFDVIFFNNGKEIFLGRFNGDLKKINAQYNNEKIIIYNEEKLESNECVITNVLSMYNIIDDTFYSVSEEEAIKLFDSNINSLHLKNKNNLINRSDIRKKQIQKLKSIF